MMVRQVLVCMKGTGRLSRAKPNRQTELETLRAEVGEREGGPDWSQEETGGERRPTRRQPMKGSVERRLLWWSGSWRTSLRYWGSRRAV